MTTEDQGGRRTLRVSAMRSHERKLVAEEFGVRQDPAGMAQDLARLRIGQAEVAMLLLSVDEVDAVERVCGVRVRRMRSGVPPRTPRPAKVAPRQADDRRLAYVRDFPDVRDRRPPRFEHARLGRTVAALVKRGVTRRDLRNWIRDGHVRLEGSDEEA